MKTITALYHILLSTYFHTNSNIYVCIINTPIVNEDISVTSLSYLDPHSSPLFTKIINNPILRTFIKILS